MPHIRNDTNYYFCLSCQDDGTWTVDRLFLLEPLRNFGSTTVGDGLSPKEAWDMTLRTLRAEDDWAETPRVHHD